MALNAAVIFPLLSAVNVAVVWVIKAFALADAFVLADAPKVRQPIRRSWRRVKDSFFRLGSNNSKRN